MSIHYIYAPEGKEYRPTYTGRKYRIDAKFKADPRLKKRIPRRWLSMGWVEEVKNDREEL